MGRPGGRRLGLRSASSPSPSRPSCRPSSSPARRSRRCTATRCCCAAADDPRARHRRPPARHEGARCGPLAGVLRPAGARRRAARRCSVGEFRADTLMLIRAGRRRLPQTLDPARRLRRDPRAEPAEDQRRLRLRRRRGADRSGRGLPRDRDRPRRDRRLHRLRRPDRRGRRGRGRRAGEDLRRHLRRRRRRPGRRHACGWPRARTR